MSTISISSIVPAQGRLSADCQQITACACENALRVGRFEVLQTLSKLVSCATTTRLAPPRRLVPRECHYEGGRCRLTGPRDYRAGTERALFDLAQGTCYYPGCNTPTMSMTGQRVVVATVRNIGGLPASIDSISIYFLLGPSGTHGEASLLGRNDFPTMNPTLPARLDVGASINWLTSLDTFGFVISQAARSGVEVEEFRAEVALGSGEKITSGPHAVALLPLV